MLFLNSVEIGSYAKDILFHQDNLLFLYLRTRRYEYMNPAPHKTHPRVTQDKCVYFSQ